MLCKGGGAIEKTALRLKSSGVQKNRLAKENMEKDNRG
jgi:hypothetical protein